MKKRDYDILAMREEGKTFKVIAAELGISTTRASSLYSAARNKLHRGEVAPTWTEGLSTKTANAIIAAGYKSKEQIISGLQSGDIGIRQGTTNGKILGVAKASIIELSLWAGVKTTEQDQAIREAVIFLEAHGYKVSKA